MQPELHGEHFFSTRTREAQARIRQQLYTYCNNASSQEVRLLEITKDFKPHSASGYQHTPTLPITNSAPLPISSVLHQYCRHTGATVCPNCASQDDSPGMPNHSQLPAVVATCCLLPPSSVVHLPNHSTISKGCMANTSMRILVLTAHDKGTLH